MNADKVKLQGGERLEPLGSGISVIVSDENHFSTDTILLADFSAPKKHERVLEFGTGCGAISLIWCRGIPPKSIISVDIQKAACDMLERSVRLNALGEIITVINEDLKKLGGTIDAGSIDMIAMNPPYKLGGSGIVNENAAKQIARHETECTTDDITRSASYLLRFGGRLCLCQRPERLTDVLDSMRRSGIEPKKLRFVQQRQSKAPKLFLVEGRRGGAPGGLVLLPTLLIEDEKGGFSTEMLSIYGDYKEGHV